MVELARGFTGTDQFVPLRRHSCYAKQLSARLARAGRCGSGVTVKRIDAVSLAARFFVNEKFELVDLREKPKPGRRQPVVQRGVYAFRGAILIHRESWSARLARI